MDMFFNFSKMAAIYAYFGEMVIRDGDLEYCARSIYGC